MKRIQKPNQNSIGSAIAKLPKDQESVYYLNVREIPPRSEKANVLQIALQTKIKLFYRPAAIATKERMDSIPQENDIKLVKQGSGYIVKNPSPYFLSITQLKKAIRTLVILSQLWFHRVVKLV